MSPFDRGRRRQLCGGGGGGFARGHRFGNGRETMPNAVRLLQSVSLVSSGKQAEGFSKRNIGSYISPLVPLSRGRLSFRERMHIDKNTRKERVKWPMKYPAKEIS